MHRHSIHSHTLYEDKRTHFSAILLENKSSKHRKTVSNLFTATHPVAELLIALFNYRILTFCWMQIKGFPYLWLIKSVSI